MSPRIRISGHVYRVRLRVVFFQSISVGSEWRKKSGEFDLENPGSHDTAGNTISSLDTVDVRGTPPGGRKSQCFHGGEGNTIIYGGMGDCKLRSNVPF